MEDAFGLVVIIVVLVGAVAATLAYIGSGKLYKGIGRSGAFSIDESDLPRGPAPGSAQAKAEADAEIRQLLEAKSARREARGQAPLDVDAEFRALTTAPPPRDAALREEVRQHVEARNARREARGQAPLDVESEIDRQLRELGA
jgi:hypothetical protein